MCTNLRLAGNAWLVGGWGYHWDLEILESPLWSHSDHRDVQESLIEQLERSERNSRVASVQKIDSEPMKWYNLAQILQTASLSSTDCQWMFAGGNIQQKGQKLMLMDGRSYQFHPCGISWCNREIFCRKTCPVFGYMRTFFSDSLEDFHWWEFPKLQHSSIFSTHTLSSSSQMYQALSFWLNVLNFSAQSLQVKKRHFFGSNLEETYRETLHYLSPQEIQNRKKLYQSF